MRKCALSTLVGAFTLANKFEFTGKSPIKKFFGIEFFTQPQAVRWADNGADLEVGRLERRCSVCFQASRSSTSVLLAAS